MDSSNGSASAGNHGEKVARGHDPKAPKQAHVSFRSTRITQLPRPHGYAAIDDAVRAARAPALAVSSSRTVSARVFHISIRDASAC